MARRDQPRFVNLRYDLAAGSVLGIESVPDGLATGLLAGVNPLAGVYGYMVGMVGGAVSTSSVFMAVQGTGAMAILVADVGTVHNAGNPDRALFTLSILTGVVMMAAGLLKLGGVLRFVSNAVMVGFINAVGVNIILGQLANLTGYSSPQGNRITRALDTLLHPGRLHWQSVVIGVVTIVLIVVLERTPLGSLGLVVAVVVTSAAAIRLGWDVAQVSDLGAQLGTLPRPQLPEFESGAIFVGTGTIAGARWRRARGRHLGQLPEPRRQFPRRVTGLHWTRCRKRGVWRLSGDASGWVGVSFIAQ